MRAWLVADTPAVRVVYRGRELGHVVDLDGGNACLLIANLRSDCDHRGR